MKASVLSGRLACEPERMIGSGGPWVDDHGDSDAFTVRPLGPDRARVSYCGGHLDVVVGDTIDRHWMRQEWVAAVRAVARVAPLYADLAVLQDGSVRWQGRVLTCSLYAQGCNPNVVRPVCADVDGGGIWLDGDRLEMVGEIGGMCVATRRPGFEAHSSP